jgi:hypothetical protein
VRKENVSCAIHVPGVCYQLPNQLTAASDKVYQLLAQGRWFSPGTPACSTTKTGRHDITEILLKATLNTNIQIQLPIQGRQGFRQHILSKKPVLQRGILAKKINGRSAYVRPRKVKGLRISSQLKV